MYKMQLILVQKSISCLAVIFIIDSEIYHLKRLQYAI